MIYVLRPMPDFRMIPTPGGLRILGVLDVGVRHVGQDLRLTAGTNDHTSGPHIRGDAYDVGVKELTVPQILRLKELTEQLLGPRFTVLYECPTVPIDPALRAIAYINGDASAVHLHVQVKKDTVFPPLDGTATV